MYTNIQRWGNSNAVRLPKLILESAHIAENAQVEILADGDHIVIQPVHRAPASLDELFAGFSGTYDFAEQFTGSAGREVL